MTAAGAALVKGLSAVEEDVVIKNRFLTQMAMPKGNPPLKTLIKKYLQLLEVAEKSQPDDIQKAYKEFLRELGQTELHAKKLKAICETNKREQEIYTEKQAELEAAIVKARQDIEEKKVALQQAKLVRQQNEEYEVLRHLIAEQPSRTKTQQDMQRIHQDMQKLAVQELGIGQVLEKRRKQFALLFHVIEELQRACEDNDYEIAAQGSDAMDVDGS